MGPKDSGSSSWDPRGAEGILALRPVPVEVRGGLAESLPVRGGSPLTPAPTPSTLRSRRAPAPPTQGQAGAPLLSLKPCARQLSAHAAGQAGLEVTPSPHSGPTGPPPTAFPFRGDGRPGYWEGLRTNARPAPGRRLQAPSRLPRAAVRSAPSVTPSTFHAAAPSSQKSGWFHNVEGPGEARPPRPPLGSQSVARRGSSGNAGSQWALPARAGRLSGPWTAPLSFASAGVWSPTRARNAADPETGLSGGGAPTLSVRSSLPLTPLHTRAGAAV